MSNQLADNNINSQTAPYAAFILRVSLGIMFLAHGVVLKYATFTLAGTAQYFESIGYPGFFAYLVFAGETLAGIALIAGFQTRLVAFASLPILIGALLEHTGNGWVFSAQGGGWEYPAFLIVLAVVQGLLGGGKFAITKKEFPLPVISNGDGALATR